MVRLIEILYKYILKIIVYSKPNLQEMKLILIEVLYQMVQGNERSSVKKRDVIGLKLGQ